MLGVVGVPCAAAGVEAQTPHGHSGVLGLFRHFGFNKDRFGIALVGGQLRQQLRPDAVGAVGGHDGETLAAYLLMVRPAGSRVSQLDYFAVLPEYRSAGLGAQLLADLPQHERGAQAILIEAECPDKAEDEAMAVRRLGFYSRCGARDTGFTEHLFDAWFRILVLDCPGAGTFADRQAVDALVDCYRRTISETEWQKYVQFYCPDGTKYC